jgi:DNA-binding IclR family transcriptional regulator
LRQLRVIQTFDENKAILRIIEFLYISREKDYSIMTYQKIAEKREINRTKFRHAIETLQTLGLLEEQKIKTPGKKGVSKRLKLTPVGLDVAEEVQRLLQLLREMRAR